MSQSSFVGYSNPNPVVLHTQGNAAPLGLFDEDNILFIQSKISEVLAREYKQRILINRGDIIRLIGRVVEEKLDTIPRINQRVVMYACNHFRINQAYVDRNLKLEAHYVLSQRLYDPSSERVSYDPAQVKLANRLGKDRVGGTARFYFT